MWQERLNGLVILSIDKIMLENIEYKNLIINFASQKARIIIKSNWCHICFAVIFLFEY